MVIDLPLEEILIILQCIEGYLDEGFFMSHSFDVLRQQHLINLLHKLGAEDIKFLLENRNIKEFLRIP